MYCKKLTKEQLEEAAQCKTNEERMAFLKKHNIPLSDDMLDKISGGNDEDDYYICPICKEKFDGWFNYKMHGFDHVLD